MPYLGLELPQALLDQVFEHAEREYPNEACGVLTGPEGGAGAERVEPLRNVQDRYHKLDPVRFSRSARDAFRIDELERMRLLDRLAAEGWTERVIYHSHCDAGAYFSPEDRAMAVRDGEELLPGVLHLVVSVRDGKRFDAALFRYDPARGVFDEARLPLAAPPAGLPDLSERGMEGREAARPIRPVGTALVSRQVTEEEARALSLRATHRVLAGAGARTELCRFALGLWSPLPGFQPPGPPRAEGGILWQRPVVLELEPGVEPPPAGTLVELMWGARPAAALWSERSGIDAGVSWLSGPVFVYPADHGGASAADTRAELLRRNLLRVLALPGPWDETRHGRYRDRFDGFLVGGAPPAEGMFLPFPHPTGNGWADAVIAQNLGATHLWAGDEVSAAQIPSDLGIAAFRGS